LIPGDYSPVFIKVMRGGGGMNMRSKVVNPNFLMRTVSLRVSIATGRLRGKGGGIGFLPLPCE